MSDQAKAAIKRRPMPSGHVQPWQWRWLGWERWHRLAIGPFCLSIWPAQSRSRFYMSHTWRYRHEDGQYRHHQTFGRWLRSVRRVRQNGSCSPEPDGTEQNIGEGS